MDVHITGGETGFGENFPEFRKGPQAPVVGEGPIDAGAIAEFKVDVTNEVVVDHVEVAMFPFVDEGGYFFPVGGDRVGDAPDIFVVLDATDAAEGVHDEEAVRSEATADVFKVFAEGLAGLEQGVGEVKGADGFGAWPVDFANIAMDEGDAASGFPQGRKMVFAGPVEGGKVIVHADGEVFRVALNPGGADAGGAAKVLTEHSQGTSAFPAEHAGDEVEVGIDLLNRGFIEDMFIPEPGGEGRGGFLHGGCS